MSELWRKRLEEAALVQEVVVLEIETQTASWIDALQETLLNRLMMEAVQSASQENLLSLDFRIKLCEIYRGVGGLWLALKALREALPELYLSDRPSLAKYYKVGSNLEALAPGLELPLEPGPIMLERTLTVYAEFLKQKTAANEPLFGCLEDRRFLLHLDGDVFRVSFNSKGQSFEYLGVTLHQAFAKFHGALVRPTTAAD